MGAGRIAGAIFSLLAGALVLYGVLIYIFREAVPFTEPIILVNIGLSALALVGGILGLLGKMPKLGGVLASIAGLLWVCGAFFIFIGIDIFMHVSGFLFIFDVMYFYYYSFEGVIALVGGAMLLVAPSD